MRCAKNKLNKNRYLQGSISLHEKTLPVMKNSFINSSNAYYMFWPACPSSDNVQYKLFRRLVAAVCLENRKEISSSH
jgi:hypothetical protein